MRFVIKTSKGYLYSGNTFFEFTKDIFKAKNFQTRKTAMKWANEIFEKAKKFGYSDQIDVKVVGIEIKEIDY